MAHAFPGHWLRGYKPTSTIYFTLFLKTFEPRHEISNNVVYATSKASDQPANTRSLIRAFASRWVLSYWLSIIWSL